jgi:hypothetical protein
MTEDAKRENKPEERHPDDADSTSNAEPAKSWTTPGAAEGDRETVEASLREKAEADDEH